MEAGTLISFDNLLRVLNEYRQMVVSLYRDKLIDDDHVASHALIDNINYIIKKGDKEVEVDLRLRDYWKYVENDTKPHFPPINAILEWVKVKPVLPSKTYDGKLPTQKQLAFLIARKIDEKGTNGSHDLQQTVQEVNAMFEQRIGEAITQDLNDAMISIITEFQMK